MTPNNNPHPQKMNPSEHADDHLNNPARSGPKGEEVVTGGETPPVETTLDDLKRQVSALEQSLQSAEDRFLRSQAELENSRKRLRRDMEEERRYAGLALVRDLLAVMDNLSRALSASSPQDDSPVIAGLRLVTTEFQNVLEKHNCRRIPAEGMPFDPNFHSAIGQMPSKDHAPGTIVQVVQDGYQLHDRVIRPAQVLIAAPAADHAAAASNQQNSN